jgi:hypothetical protein
MAAARKWNIWFAFLIGGVLGAVLGAARGVIVYGQFDIGFLFNHVLGGFFLVGTFFLAVAFVRNWFRRHPV